MSCETNQNYGKPLNLLEKSKLLFGELFTNLLLISKRKRRTTDRVSTEYNSGYWKNILDEKHWIRSSNIKDFLNPKQTCEERIAKINNRLVRINTYDYYEYRSKRLREIIEQFGGNDHEIVELGCGFGMNIFTLHANKKWEKLIGLDISTSGIEAAREIAQYFNLNHRVYFDHIDLTQTGHKNFQYLEGKTVFTYYCLEQLKHLTPNVIENILLAGPKRLIHIEPTTELLRLWVLNDLVNYLYILRRDYQNNLLKTLKSFEKKGRIRVIYQKRLYYSPTCRHDPTLVCWEPT